jgi:hypothetical protein
VGFEFVTEIRIRVGIQIVVEFLEELFTCKQRRLPLSA